MSRAIQIRTHCHECGHTFIAHVLPGRPARIYGDPLDCYPAEPDEVDPSECPKCGVEVDLDDSIEQAQEILDNERASAAEARERRMEEE